MEVSDKQVSYEYRSFQEIGKKLRVQKCVKCNSYFIENNRCETCGHNQNLDLLGVAFGEKSVFFRKEMFVENRPWYFDYLTKSSQIKTDHVRQYKRFLSMRLKRIIQNFESEDNYHKLEFRVLVDEYLTWGGDITWIMGLVSQSSQVSTLKAYASKAYEDYLFALPEATRRYHLLAMTVGFIILGCGLSLILFNISIS